MTDQIDCKHEPDLARSQQSRDPTWSVCKHCGKTYLSDYARGLRERQRDYIKKLRKGWQDYCDGKEQTR